MQLTGRGAVRAFFTTPLHDCVMLMLEHGGDSEEAAMAARERRRQNRLSMDVLLREGSEEGRSGVEAARVLITYVVTALSRYLWAQLLPAMG